METQFSRMDFALKVLIGFVVGTLIGMTGVGGGVLLLPVLIFGLRVPPILAVGSDALFNFFTKIGSGWMHFTHGTVRPRVVGRSEERRVGKECSLRCLE